MAFAVVMVYVTFNACVAGVVLGSPLFNSAKFPPDVEEIGSGVVPPKNQPSTFESIVHPYVAPVCPELSTTQFPGTEKSSDQTVAPGCAYVKVEKMVNKLRKSILFFHIVRIKFW